MLTINIFIGVLLVLNLTLLAIAEKKMKRSRPVEKMRLEKLSNAYLFVLVNLSIPYLISLYYILN